MSFLYASILSGLLFCCTINQAASNEQADDFLHVDHLKGMETPKEEALSLFPMNVDLSYESISPAFQKILSTEQSKGFYDYAFLLMFNRINFQQNNEEKYFPYPPHTVEMINRRWNTLLKTVYESTSSKEEITILYTYLIKTHKGLFEKIDNDFVEEIKKNL